jgi:hypothetical protein
MLVRVNLVIALVILCGCTNSNDRPQQPDAKNNPKDGKVKPVDPPFMEHPSGDFETAVDAMADAIKRLRALPEWKNWITVSAQGMGGRVDSYHIAEIRVRQDEFKLQKPMDVDIELVTKRAGVPQSCLSKNGDVYSIAKATPVQAARIMDVIFRQYLGIRPHTGEGDDYAVGAEW